MKYTIGTLVTNWDEYDTMKETFISKGFTENDCEYITLDNSVQNLYDAFDGNNLILNQAKGMYVILCHQDVRILYDDRNDLDMRLEQLTEFDPYWGLAGNAGGVELNVRALRITDPYGYNQSVGGPFPVKTQTLDGNFIIVRRDTRLGFSVDLSGFHFYDADICMHADQMGYNVYVIDFHLRHIGSGNIDNVFWSNEKAFREKWSHNLRGRVIQLTTVPVKLTYPMR